MLRCEEDPSAVPSARAPAPSSVPHRHLHCHAHTPPSAHNAAQHSYIIVFPSVPPTGQHKGGTLFRCPGLRAGLSLTLRPTADPHPFRSDCHHLGVGRSNICLVGCSASLWIPPLYS